MTLSVVRQYDIEILEHPQEGAQEWLGNTKHMFTELLTFAVDRTEQLRMTGAMQMEVHLYVDRSGTKSETGTYYWTTAAFHSLQKDIKKLYGPVKLRVSLADTSVMNDWGSAAAILTVDRISDKLDYMNKYE